MSFANQLADLQEDWDDMTEDGSYQSDFQDLAPGTYIAWLIGAELGESQAGRLQVAWTFRVARGDSAAEEQMSWQGLDRGKESLQWLARDLAKLDYEIESFDFGELETYLEDIESNPPLVQINVKEKDGYTNVRLQKTVDENDFDDLIFPDEDVDADGDEEPEAKPRQTKKKPPAKKKATKGGGSTKKKAASGGGKKSTKKAPAKKKPATKKKKAPEPEPEPEEDLTFASLGETIDNEEDEDGEALKALQKGAKECDLDEDAYATWAELGEAIDEAADEEPEVEEVTSTINWEVLRADADEETSEAIAVVNDLLLHCDLDGDNYPTWGEAVDACQEAEGDVDFSEFSYGEESGEAGEGEFEVGQVIMTTVNNKPRSGVIEEIDGETLTIKPKKGNRFKKEADECELADEDVPF